MIPRLYVNQRLTGGETVLLEKAASRYLTGILRLRPGAEVILFNGEGGEYRAVLAETKPVGVVTIGDHNPELRESPAAITVIAGLSKQHAMELEVQKGTELGMARFIPLVAQRSVARPGKAANKTARWTRIAIEAAEQSGRTRVPEILEPIGWDALPSLLPSSGPRLMFWEEEKESLSWIDVLKEQTPVTSLTVLIGPEGGLTREEAELAQGEMGFLPAGFGPRTLRAETAAIAALTAVQLLIGDLGNGRG